MEKQNNYLVLSAEEFAKWILNNLNIGDSVTFGLDRLDENEAENWWFAKLISIPEGDSLIVVIDYCGGGFPTAFPVNDPMYQEDEEFLIEAIAHYFRKDNESYNDDEKITVDLDTISRLIRAEKIQRGGNNNV